MDVNEIKQLFLAADIIQGKHPWQTPPDTPTVTSYPPQIK